MVKRNHVKVLLSLDDRKKLTTFFGILMVVDKQMKAKKHAKKINKSKESKIENSQISCTHNTIGSHSFSLCCKATKSKTRALSLSNNSPILSEISWTYFIGNTHHVGYHSYYPPQQHVHH